MRNFVLGMLFLSAATARAGVVTDWMVQVDSARARTVEQAAAAPVYAKPQFEVFQEYFGAWDLKADELSVEPRFARKLNRYWSGRDLQEFCAKTLIDTASWKRIVERCERHGYFVCPESVRTYASNVAALKGLLKPKLQAAMALEGGNCARLDPTRAEIAKKQAARTLVVRKVYVANEDAGTVSVLDPDSGSVLAEIDLTETHGSTTKMYMPHNVQTAPDGKSVWVTAPPMDHGTARKTSKHAMGDELIVIDPATDTIRARMTLGKDLHPAHVVFDDESRFAYVTAFETGQLFEVSTATLKITRTLDLGKDAGPHGMRFCAGTLFVAEMKAKALAAVDAKAFEVVKTVDTRGVTVQTACSPDGGTAMATLYDTREIVRWDLKTDRLERLALPTDSQGPVQLTLSPDATRVYVADQGILLGRPASKYLYEVDLSTWALGRTIEVGKGPHGVAVAADGSKAYVTNLADATVSVVDLASGRVLSTIAVGDAPNGITEWVRPE